MVQAKGEGKGSTKARLVNKKDMLVNMTNRGARGKAEKTGQGRQF
jgi:hypothetical protein